MNYTYEPIRVRVSVWVGPTAFTKVYNKVNAGKLEIDTCYLHQIICIGTRILCIILENMFPSHLLTQRHYFQNYYFAKNDCVVIILLYSVNLFTTKYLSRYSNCSLLLNNDFIIIHSRVSFTFSYSFIIVFCLKS